MNPGTTVSHYEILGQLGSGGMGVVYRARDTQLDRTVALKFLPQHLSADASAKRRFIQEAKAASALDHANICTILHIGETNDGQVYIVMSYYEGQTLKYLLNDGPLPEETALNIARQLAAGLHRAHLEGIVHRDIKPANVMVTVHGEVKILDFGIAKLGAVSDMTGEGATLGTVSYMSPEQTRGEKVGPATDLWSLGVVLYEMLAGRRPFGGDYDQAVTYAILNEPPDDIQEAAPNVSDDTAEVVRQLLEKDPEARPTNASDVYRALGGSTATMVTGTLTGAGVGRAAPASMLGVSIWFAAAGILALAAVYGAMIFFGLPDWVFPLGVLLLLAGAPITLYATRLDRQKARMDTGQRQTMSWIASWLTLRRAITGGVLAMAGLGVVSGGYMALRAMGVGPAATLITSGAFSDDDVIVVADFADETTAGNMGAPIAEALRVDLNQSDVVKLMDAATVKAVLTRMDIKVDTTLTAAIAQEVAIREGAKAVLVGAVSSLGSSYVISLRLLSAATGDELVALRETAKSDADVVDAVDKLSASFRERVGESLISIRDSEPLSQVTTGSLEALRLYTLAEAAKDRDDAEAALGFLQVAIELDPAFAMAYRLMAAVENNRWGARSRMIGYARKAYEHRDRLSRKERLHATEAYYNWVERDADKLVQLYHEMLDNDPTDRRAINNLSLHHRYRSGDYQKSLEFSRRLIQLDPRKTQGYINTFFTLTRTGEWDEAQVMLDSIGSLQPEYSGLSWMRLALYAERTRNYAAALDTLAVYRKKDLKPETEYFLSLYETSILMMLGRHREAEASLEAAVRSSEAINNREGMLRDMLRMQVYRFLADQDVDGARRRFREAILRVDPASLDPVNQLYGERAYLLAAVGQTEEAKRIIREQETNVVAAAYQADILRPATAGMIALTEARYSDAVAAYEGALGIFHIPRVLEHELGLALLLAGRTEEAARTLEKAARSPGWQGLAYDQGNSTLALRTLGEAYETLGNTAEAIRAYEEFLTRWEKADPHLQPQVEDVRDRVASLLASGGTDRAERIGGTVLGRTLGGGSD